MSDRNFSRRRRGMRFRPSGGLAQKPDRSAQEARAEATGNKEPDAVFERPRHEQEIERAQNVAAGLPPEGAHAAESEAGGREGEPRDKRGAFRRPRAETAPEPSEQKFEPVSLQTE